MYTQSHRKSKPRQQDNQKMKELNNYDTKILIIPCQNIKIKYLQDMN